ncbi:TrbI/VirB10 family protein [Sphingorhabdus sp.]|uniref:TrbI/VirB10 family protein n=1 Tax=Sphingorhabdus sp. TaxID=1902408 RepID=UPI0035936950
MARAVSKRGAWVFGAALAIGAVALFAALEARRITPTSPATIAQPAGSSDMISAPPALAIPAAPPTDAYPPPFGATIISRPPGPFAQATPIMPRAPRGTSRPAAPDYVAPSYPDYRYVPPASTPSQLPDLAAPPKVADPESLAGPRAGATRLANPTTTVPKGAVIQAVLETALDSNRPGFARAIVSRDVRGFDGSRILIPRGSRLVGEYKADLVQGQNRAFVQWQTLTRPDGVQIAVDSPAADPLGRAGVKGNVNSHFFERFAGAILQSTLDIGVGIATRKVADGTVIVGLPGSSQSVGGITPQSIKPTLKVPHGSSVSVFVARDLDFIAVE